MKFKDNQIPPEEKPKDNYPQHYREARDRQALSVAEGANSFEYEGKEWAEQFKCGANWSFDYLQPKQNSLGMILSAKDMDLIHAGMKKAEEIKTDNYLLRELLKEATNIFVRDGHVERWFQQVESALRGTK